MLIQTKPIALWLRPSNRPTAVDNLLRREADIAVRMAQPNQAIVVARRIGKIYLGTYAHRDYLTITDQQLILILPDIAIPPIPVWLAVHREVRTNKRIRAVYSFLATHLPTTLEPAQ